MQVLVDFLPLIVFFAAYMLYDIYVATAAIMAAMALQIAYLWLRYRKVNKMLLASGGLVLVLGGITLVLRNPLFLQWKVTLVDWLFAGAFLGSQFFGKKTLAERAMGQAIELDAGLWRQLNLQWVIVFLALGAANLYVMYNFSEAVWVYFKVWGQIGVTFLTAVGQSLWVVSRTSSNDSEADTKKSS
jgi:intracellular septation protein